MITLSPSIFAWTHANSAATICNKTSSSTFHFEKTYAYQANTNDYHSSNFILHPNECTDIFYWMEFRPIRALDNDLQFTDSLGSGSFHIKATASSLYTMSNNVQYFNMPNFMYTASAGTWSWILGNKNTFLYIMDK